MNQQPVKTQKSQQLVRKILMWFGLIMFMIVFIPYIMEYIGIGPEKHFGTKEATILSISFVLAIGAKYWEKITLAIVNRFRKNPKSE